MRIPTAPLVTACALSAALLVVGRGGEGENDPAPGSEVVAPAAEGRVLLTDPFDASFTDPFEADPPDAEPDPGSDPVLDADADADADDSGAGLDRDVEPDGPDEPDGPGEVGEAEPDDIGPETVPEVPDLPDGGGLIPDGPDESDVLPG